MEAEALLVSEYLAQRWPKAETWQRVRVGGYPRNLPTEGLTEAERRMLGVWRRWVDAVTFFDGRVTLIEAGVLADPGDVSQLDLYLRLFPHTQEFQDYIRYPRRGLLVYAISDPVVNELARERGYTVDTFCPPWVVAYLRRRLPHLRTPPLPQGGLESSEKAKS